MGFGRVGGGERARQQNLAHQRLPPPVLQVACLFGGRVEVWRGRGDLQNEFDGLIVAPSGQRRSSQRAGGAQTVDQELSGAERSAAGGGGGGEGAKFSPSSLDACTWLLRRLLISPSSRLVFMNVGNVPDTYHSPSCSLILQHVSTFFSPLSFSLSPPPFVPQTRPAWPIGAFFSSPPSFFPLFSSTSSSPSALLCFPTLRCSCRP